MTQYGPIRLTLDEDLRAQPTDGLCFSAPGDTPICANQVILELKFRYAMPTLFKYLLEEFALNPQPLSKYRLAVTALNLAATAAAAPIESSTYQYA
jgi:hypothetical protein